MVTTEKWDRAFEFTMPVISIGIGVLSVYLATMALTRSSSLGQRVYHQNGQYLVAVRYPWQRNNICDFVQPSNPDVLAVYSQVGPDYWSLYDFVCRNVSYRLDLGEFWQIPSETLRGYGDCEDCAILLTSLIRVSRSPNCYVALGNLGGYGHAWCQLDGQILETTYTHARPIPNPHDYCPYFLFNEQTAIELWPGALDEVFRLNRDEATKFNLLATVLEAK
ncbi:hypothetical protein ES703_102773 [subsurface metagenome]